MCNEIKDTSKRDQTIAREHAEYAYGRGKNWTYDDIWSAYSKPSLAKIRAWEFCKSMCKELNGHSLIISARSSHFFSACFKFEDEGRDCYAYITYANNRFCYA